MHEPPQRPGRRNKLAFLAGVAIALAALVFAFDWTWFRPLIQQHIYSRSHRHLDFDELHFGLSREWEPTVRVRGLTIENAPWADRRPLVRAGELRATLAWRSLTDDRIIVTRLVLADADVDLELQADGLRNWRLRHPDDRGPGRIRVLALDAQRSRLRFVDRGLDLEFSAETAPLAANESIAGREALPLTRTIVFRGASAGLPFSGEVHVSDLLTFFDTGVPFALRGNASAAHAHMEIEGTAADLAKLAEVDARVRMTGATLSELGPLLRSSLPASKAFAIDAHVHKAGGRSALSQLRLRIGQTDIEGELVYLQPRSEDARPFLQAELRSDAADLGDIASHHGFDASRLKRLDAQLSLKVARLKAAAIGSVQGVGLSALLKDGVLTVDPMHFGIASGQVSGGIKLDANRVPSSAEIKLDLNGLRLDRLLPQMPEAQRIGGLLHGHAVLHATGDSVAALRSSLAGSVTLGLNQATIASRLEARLALNAGAMFRTLLGANEQMPVQCASLLLDFHRGVGTARRLSLETERMQLIGGGTVDLPGESLDLLITPHPKQFALLALHDSIQVKGPFHAAKITLVKPVAFPRQQGCGDSAPRQ